MQKGKAEGLSLGERKGKAEGLLLGEEKGKADGLMHQKTTLLEMLSQRFGIFTQEWSERIYKLPNADAISQLMIALLTVKTIGEFEAMLDQFL